MIKNIRFTKKTLDYENIHTVKMARKCVTMPTTDIVQLIVNPPKTPVATGLYW